MVIRFICFFISAYILGSVNVSIILFKFSGKGDPRLKFSKNAGATNVYRQAGLPWAAAVLVLDMARAMIIAWASLYFLDTAYITWTGLALILGNRYPVFHGFNGGKGVANYLGFTLVLAPYATLAASLAWGAAYLVFRTPFISSFAMTILLATGTMNVFLDSLSSVAGTCLTVLLIFYNHKDNVIEKLKT